MKTQIEQLELEARFELDRRNGVSDEQLEQIRMWITMRNDYEIVLADGDYTTLRKATTKELESYVGANKERDDARFMLWGYVDDYIQYGIWTDDEIKMVEEREADTISYNAAKQRERELIESWFHKPHVTVKQEPLTKVQTLKFKRAVKEIKSNFDSVFIEGEDDDV